MPETVRTLSLRHSDQTRSDTVGGGGARGRGGPGARPQWVWSESCLRKSNYLTSVKKVNRCRLTCISDPFLRRYPLPEWVLGGRWNGAREGWSARPEGRCTTHVVTTDEGTPGATRDRDRHTTTTVRDRARATSFLPPRSPPVPRAWTGFWGSGKGGDVRKGDEDGVGFSSGRSDPRSPAPAPTQSLLHETLSGPGVTPTETERPGSQTVEAPETPEETPDPAQLEGQPLPPVEGTQSSPLEPDPSLHPYSPTPFERVLSGTGNRS